MSVFNKVLIANRGEIAVRIIRACRELGIRTVAVYSKADESALHARIADEAICIGPASIKDSYLNKNAIISACEITQANAIHPGFGFLSENAAFANMCEKCGIKFIGPKASTIDMMGDKASAKQAMKEAGVPVIPGSDGIVKTIEDAKVIAEQIKYPVMIKATAGGGGRGIRLVTNESELENAFNTATQEAIACFGDGGVYIEKFIEEPRHVEIQIMSDSFGNVVHLGERDCSIQRRNQKLIEEAPCPLLNQDIRDKMGAAAVNAAKKVGYENVGTVEFLLDKHGDFYFMEMNTRVQVEHPVTELVTGVDIVKQQILIAQGEKLAFAQDDISIKGHAIECRINAENPKFGFRPSPGTITALHMPGGPGVRIDSSVYQGYTITPFYDSMIAKLIVYAPTRAEAIMKMRWALSEFIVVGVDTTIDFQLGIVKTKEFETAQNYSKILSEGHF